MFRRLFLDHPAAVDETYFEHMRASLGIASQLLVAGGKCVIHAIVPAWCKTSGSTAILKLYAHVAPRRFDQPTI
jgi:hypothetical protein